MLFNEEDSLRSISLCKVSFLEEREMIRATEDLKEVLDWIAPAEIQKQKDKEALWARQRNEADKELHTAQIAKFDALIGTLRK